MCGIVAVTGRDVRPGASKLLEALRHRGPDDSGLVDFGPVALAASRLAILDPAPRAGQPMGSAGRHLAYNGELYNFAELRAELAAAGISFTTTGDTEVVLQAVVRWGQGACQRFRGMFALIVFDETTGELWAARDRYGIKPLYWRTRPGGGIALASEATPLAAMGAAGTSVAGLADFLRFGAPVTSGIFDGVSELEPGTVTTWRPDGSRRAEPYRQEAAHCPGAWLEPADLLHQSVTEHLVADRPVALFLSGGFDSGALAAQSHQAARPPTALSLAYPGNGADLARARATAAHFDLDHRVVHLETGDLAAQIAAFLAAMDQPTVDGLNTFLVAGIAADEGFPVALSGLGGDEVLGGYGYYRRLALFNLAARGWRRLPSPLRRAGIVVGSRHYARPPGQLVAMLEARTLPDLHQSWRSLFTAAEVTRLTGTALPASDPGQVDPVSSPGLQLHRLDLETYLRPVLLRDTDAYSMAHGVEVRVPFLDHRLVSAANQGSASFTKTDLARQLGDAYLGGLARRPKLAFSLPWGRWLRVAREVAGEVLADVDPWRGLVDPAPARAVVERRGPEGRNSPLRAWALIALSCWLARQPQERSMPARRSLSTPPPASSPPIGTRGSGRNWGWPS